MSDDEILALAMAFEDASLPAARWTHAAHLTTALVFVRDAGAAGALTRLREALPRYVRAVGGNPAGYHETLTRAWVEVVASFDAEAPTRPLADAARLLIERCGDKRYLLRHYSEACLFSDEARKTWVPPDQSPIA